MLRMMIDKMEEEKNEAYKLQKIEELRKSNNTENAKPTLIVQEKGDEFGWVEVWSTELEYEEVRKPTHGEYFVGKAEAKEYAGKCLMVKSERSEQKEFATEIVVPLKVVS